MPTVTWRLALGAGVAAVTAAAVPSPGVAQRLPSVSGQLTVSERGNKAATDVGNAVVWLEPARPAPITPDTIQVVTAGKEFRPRVVVVTLGSVIAFPNNDPFDHNVFSLSQEGAFDLGLYGRGEAKSTRFAQAGIIRVYCNVHAQMSAFVVVLDSPYYTQPGGDGSFTIATVPPGEYTLHAWYERAAELRPQTIRVGPAGVGDLALELDARGYKFVQHTDKFGQPYSRRGRRY